MLKKIMCICLLMCMACAEQKEKNKNASSLVEALNKIFDKQVTGTLKIDSVFMVHIDTLNRLSYQALRSWQGQPANDSLSSTLQWPMEEFCKIDSLKNRNVYAAYLDSLDIGMVKNAEAFVIGHLNWQEATLYLWAITLDSYEACPTFAGTFVIGSTLNKTGKMQHYLLAKYFTMVDPPVCSIEKSEAIVALPDIMISASQMTDEDMDAPGEKWRIKNYNFIFEGDSLHPKKIK